jgi:hypothetical protein
LRKAAGNIETSCRHISLVENYGGINGLAAFFFFFFFFTKAQKSKV